MRRLLAVVFLAAFVVALFFNGLSFWYDWPDWLAQALIAVSLISFAIGIFFAGTKNPRPTRKGSA